MSIRLDLFTRAGGIRPLAELVGEAPSTVQGWKDRRRVSSKKQSKVLQKLNAAGIDTTAEDVMFPFPEDRRA